MSTPPSPVSPTSLSAILSQWSQLTAWTVAAASLPRTADEFLNSYGRFDNESDVQSFVAAVAGIQALATEAGGPAAIKEALIKEPDYLQRGEPASPLYARLIWFAGQVYNSAASVAQTLDTLPSTTSRAEPAEAGAAVKEILAGSGGLVQQLNSVPPLADALAAALDSFDAKAKSCSAALLSTPLVNEAMAVVSRLKSANARLSAPPQKPSGGWFSRRTEADPKRDEEIAANAAEIARKQALVDQSAALLSANDGIGVVVPRVRQSVEAVALRYRGTRDRILQFASISSAEQLASPTWVSRALNINDLAVEWRAVADEAQAFTQHALVVTP